MAMIDFHAHILPGADHGSSDLETSLAQLKLAEAAGVDTIVATPHYYPQSDHWESFSARREESYRTLCENYHGPIKIALGAEVHICNGLDHLPHLRDLCIPGTDVFLLELPFKNWNSGAWETLSRLADGELTPVLAHVDRYEWQKIEELFSLGLKGQLNAEGVCRFLGRKRLIRWIREERIVAFGSDIHGTDVGYREWVRSASLLKGDFSAIQARTAGLIGKAIFQKRN